LEVAEFRGAFLGEDAEGVAVVGTFGAEAVLQVIAGGGGFAFFCDRASGELGVGLIGGALGFGRQFENSFGEKKKRLRATAARRRFGNECTVRTKRLTLCR